MIMAYILPGLCTVCRQDDEDIRDEAAGRYYLMIMAYILPGFAVIMLFVLLSTWRQKLGQLRKGIVY